jgi:hypothetical protein
VNVMLDNIINGWLCGDRRQALAEFRDLVDTEQGRA